MTYPITLLQIISIIPPQIKGIVIVLSHTVKHAYIQSNNIKLLEANLSLNNVLNYMQSKYFY